MTDAATGTAAIAAELALTAEPAVADAAGLAGLSGPFLTAAIVDQDETTIGAVAIFDGPDGGDEALLARLATSVAGEIGGTVAPGDPVAGGADIAARFPMPITAQAWTDGTQTQVVTVTAADRRVPVAEPAEAVPAAGAALPAAPLGDLSGGGLEKLINVSLDVSVELGRTRVTLAEVMEFDVGSVVELDRAAGAPVDVRVNDTLLAQGEVVLIDDEYAVRITAIFDPSQPQH